MNDYITLDGKKYHTSTNWLPSNSRSMTARRLLSGATNVTWGPATYKSWNGNIVVDVTPAAGFGTIADLRAAYETTSALTYVDHYEGIYSVVMDRGVDERSLSPMWTAPDNTINVTVTLIKI
jgi:hypothetical protein